MNFTRKVVLSFILCLSLCSKLYAQASPVNEKMQWWCDAKFGMFIHWGLFSQTAGYWDGHKAKGSEHFMIYERIPLKEYAKIANDFNPVKFNAEKWVLTAKNAGLKYIVITSKHHDGFAMFDSPSNNYNIKTCTPYAKDPMKELVDACHKHGMKFGFYYSLGRDWEDPDVPTNWPTKGGRSNTVDFPNEDAKVFNKYFERKVKPQIKELLTQYGTIDVIWFDTPELISPKESKELLAFINQLQPNCIVNSRIGNNLGDYNVLEQEIVKDTPNKPWESCITMSRNWGYIKYDTVYKSPELMVRQLLEIVSKGGNFLLNVGPTAEGEITLPACERFAAIGKWMKTNSEGIYGSHIWKVSGEILAQKPMDLENKKTDTENTMKDAENDATSKIIVPEVRFTSKGNTLYAYVCSFREKQVLLKTVSSTTNPSIKNISLIGSKKAVKWKQTPEGLILKMPTFAISEIPIAGFRIHFKK